MKYIFFDTESANSFGNIYKMCEFGVLMTNTDFAVLPGSKKDILMNPGRDGKFHLTGRKSGRDLILAHYYDEYLKAPTYEDQYDNIGYILRQPDAMIFLWAAENDIQALLDQCHRYRLPELSFVSYDVQILFRALFPEIKKRPPLEGAAKHLGMDIEGITLHRPDDDALLTSMVLKALCEKAGKSVLELVKEYSQCEMESVSTYREMLKCRQEKVAIKAKMAFYNEKLNEILAMPVPDDVPNEKIFSVSTPMRRHIDETLEPIQNWLSRGYFLKKRFSEAPVVVYYNEEDRDRLSALPELAESKLVSIDEFDAMTKS